MIKRLLLTLPLLLGGLLLLPGCRPPEDLDRGGAPKLGELSGSRRGNPPPRQSPGSDGSDGSSDKAGGDGDGVRLSSRGLGKEDYALIEAELRCIRAQFKDDSAALAKAEATIFARYGASEDWVARVAAHLNGEPDVAERLEEMIERRLGQICIDGTISPELLGGAGGGAEAAKSDSDADPAPETKPDAGDKAEGDEGEGEKAGPE
jgi:hypothetical protein